MQDSIETTMTKLGDLHSALLKIVKQFDLFCKENNLRYYAYGGTLLGAIRHKGFIPWDDDVDIGMPRADYNRLLSLVGNSYQMGDYKFVNVSTDKYFYSAFTRLVNVKTTEIPIKFGAYSFSMGCFIDIIPLDFVPDNTFLRKVYFRKCKIYIDILRVCSRFQNKVDVQGVSFSRRVILMLMFPLWKFHIISCESVYSHFHKFLSSQKGKRLGNSTIVPGDERWIFDASWFEKAVLYPFEELNIPVPERYNDILTKQYGDYMTPLKEQPSHGDTIIDVNTPYEIYKKNHKKQIMKMYYEGRIK